MFRFKQFVIQQDHTAMKVCTDACVLGAYADVAGGHLLDIGTGTGLLALMAAQRNGDALVDAIEADDRAVAQATQNVAASPFADRVRVWFGRVQDYAGRLDAQRYDCILTNPPFYTNHLRSPDAAVNRALHTDTLPFEDLVTAVACLLQPAGQWWVLLPPYETGKMVALARRAGLHPFRHLHLRHSSRKPPFRIVTGFGYGPDWLTEETLSIYEPDGRSYTADFRALLQDFYLIF